MAKQKREARGKVKIAGGRIGLRTGEALIEADEAWSAAEPEVVIGELDGPVGYAIANLLGDQTKGHSRVFAILNSDVQVRPATLMVSKVTVNNTKYTNILMGTVQAAIAHGVLDAVRAGDIPRRRPTTWASSCRSGSIRRSRGSSTTRRSSSAPTARRRRGRSARR